MFHNTMRIYKLSLSENRTLRNFKLLETEPSTYCKCDLKVIFTRPFLMLGKVTFDEHVNALEWCWKGDIIMHIYNILMAVFPKSKVIKGLISHSDMEVFH